MTQHFGFTKLVVADLDAMGGFYSAVFGLEEANRVTAAVGPRTIHEIMYKPTAPGSSPLVLFHFEDRDAAVNEESILGFISPDIDELFASIVEHGGSIVEEPHEMPEHGIRVGFAADPEGHLLELVQIVAG